MTDLNRIAETAEMIVNGYACSRIPAGIRIVNTERATACVIGVDGSVIETNMDDIELEIAEDCYRRNKRFLED